MIAPVFQFMATTLTGHSGQLARRRVATVPELVRENARTLSPCQVAKIVLDLGMMSRAKPALKDLVLVSHDSNYLDEKYKIVNSS